MRYLLYAALATCLSSPLLAQAQPTAGSLPSPQEIAHKDVITLGLGGAVIPDYEGSDDYRLIPAAAIRGKISGVSFITRGTYLYVDVVPTSAKLEFDAGPIAGFRKNTRRHIHDQIVELLPKRNTAWEVGAFAGVSFHGLVDPYDSLSLRLDVLHDIGKAHKSTTFTPNIDFSTPVSRKTFVSATVGAEFVSNRFADYYYTISPADSLATGGVLPPFNARGGMKNWKAAVLVDQSVTGDLLHGLSIFGLGQYSRLVGDFKRSPIVSQRGSANQWIGALGLAYTW